MIKEHWRDYAQYARLVEVAGYYASDMLSNARKLWEANKEAYMKVFIEEAADIKYLDSFISKGAGMHDLYDMRSAIEVIDSIYTLGQCIERFSTGERYKEAPAGGEDFGFYLIECSSALYSAIELLLDLFDEGADQDYYFTRLYQAL